MSEHVQVLVDDTDPRIVYTGGWTKSGSLYEHNFTTSRISQTSGSFSFRFNGTSISVYATIPNLDANDPQAPKITCQVDDLPIQVNIPSPQSLRYNYAQCGRSVGNDREHTLIVEVDSSSAPWSLDYLIYDAVVSDDRLVGPDDIPVQIIVDDTDPRFEYSYPKEWTRGGVADEYDGSAHWTKTPGAWTKFTFNGSAVQIYGSIINEPYSGVTSTYYLMDEGSEVQTYVNPRKEIDMEYYVYQTRFVIFSSLEEAEHTLVITVPSTSPTVNQYSQDFAVYSIKPSSLLFIQNSTLGPAPNASSDLETSPHSSHPMGMGSANGSLSQPTGVSAASTDPRGSASQDSEDTAWEDSVGSGTRTNATGSARPSGLVQSLGGLATQSGSYTSRGPLESSQSSPSNADSTSTTTKKSPVPPITIIAPIVAVLVSIAIALILIALQKKRKRNKKLHRARVMAAHNLSGSLEPGDLPPLTYTVYPPPRDGKRARRDDAVTGSTQPRDSDEMTGVGGNHGAHLTQTQGPQGVVGSFDPRPVDSTDRWRRPFVLSRHLAEEQR